MNPTPPLAGTSSASAGTVSSRTQPQQGGHRKRKAAVRPLLAQLLLRLSVRLSTPLHHHQGHPRIASPPPRFANLFARPLAQPIARPWAFLPLLPPSSPVSNPPSAPSPSSPPRRPIHPSPSITTQYPLLPRYSPTLHEYFGFHTMQAPSISSQRGFARRRSPAGDLGPPPNVRPNSPGPAMQSRPSAASTRPVHPASSRRSNREVSLRAAGDGHSAAANLPHRPLSPPAIAPTCLCRKSKRA